MSNFYVSIPPSLFEAIGVAGFILYVANYALLTFQHITSQSKTFFVINMFAASFVLIGLIQSFNLASALIQCFWIVISITAIVLRKAPPQTSKSGAQLA